MRTGLTNLTRLPNKRVYSYASVLKQSVNADKSVLRYVYDHLIPIQANREGSTGVIDKGETLVVRWI